jgi:hypothetical protein
LFSGKIDMAQAMVVGIVTFDENIHLGIIAEMFKPVFVDDPHLLI